MEALVKVDARFTADKLPVIVGETGWPTSDNTYDGASVANAEAYVRNALATKIPLYLFEAFDEQKKSGDSGAGTQTSDVENHWGVFTEAGVAKYSIAEQESSFH